MVSRRKLKDKIARTTKPSLKRQLQALLKKKEHKDKNTKDKINESMKDFFHPSRFQIIIAIATFAFVVFFLVYIGYKHFFPT